MDTACFFFGFEGFRSYQERAAGCNFARWNDPEAERLLRHCREQRSPDVLDQLLTLANEAMPVLGLAYGPTIIVHGWHVTGLHASPLGVPVLADLDLREGG